MEHCEECGQTADHLKPCKREACPVQAYEDGKKAAQETFGKIGELLRADIEQPTEKP